MEMKKLDAGELEAVVGGAISANEKENARAKVNSLPFFENPACKFASGNHSGGRTNPYIVNSGDYLSFIAKRFLNDGTHEVYSVLATANDIENPDLITPGTMIRFNF